MLFLITQNITLAEVGILQTLLFWSSIIFEVPAGFLADRFRRKYSIAFGLILIAAAAFIMPFSNSFELFALAFILHGMGFAFRSGADVALLFDELKSAGGKWSQRFVALSARSRSLTNLALVIAMVSGGFIQGHLGWLFAYSAFGVAMLIAALLTLTINESNHMESSDHPHSLPSFINTFSMLRQFFCTPEGRSVSLFVFGMGFVEATHSPFFIYIQTYFKSAGLSDAHTSLVIGLSLALTSIGYLAVHQLKDVSIDKLIAYTSIILTLLIGLFLLQPPVFVGIILFSVIDMLPSLLFVHSDNYINTQIPTSIRASLLSFHSLVSSIFVSIAFLTTGYMLDRHPPHLVLGSFIILPIMGLIFMELYFRRESRRKSMGDFNVEPIV